MPKRVYKSKKKLSSVKATYRKWSEWDAGDILIGTYKGSQTDSYDKPNWLVEVEDAQFTNAKVAKKLLPKGDEKTVIGLNSSGKLDAAMEQVEIGDMVQIEYKGMSTIEKGKYKGKDAHDIEVDLIEEDVEDDDDEDDDEVDDSDDESDEDEDDL
jgi:hypothetical protein